MAERDGEKGARKIGLRVELDTLLEQRRGGFELAGDQIGRTKKVDILVLEQGIEPDGLLDMRNSGEGLAAVDVDGSARGVRQSVIWAEVQRRVRFSRGSVEILFPRVER